MKALILDDGESRGTLAALRSLGRAGWELGLGSPQRDLLATSRFVDRWHAVPTPRWGLDRFRAAVREIVADGRYDVAFGGGDDWSVGLGLIAEGLPLRVAHPAAGIVSRGADKLELAVQGTAGGLRVPRTEPVSERTVAGWHFPAVVKPRSHWMPRHDAQIDRLDATMVADAASALSRASEIAAHDGEALIQECHTGRLLALSGLFHEGDWVRRCQQVAVTSWPVPVGVTAHAHTVPVDEDLAAQVGELLTALAWFGLAQVQFLQAPGERPVLIDLNGRFYGSMALAIAAGVDLPRDWADLVTGELDLTLRDGRPGVRYTWLEGELGYLRANPAGIPLWRRTRDLVGHLRGARHAHWDRRDPKPALRELSELARGKSRRVPGLLSSKRPTGPVGET